MNYNLVNENEQRKLAPGTSKNFSLTKKKIKMK